MCEEGEAGAAQADDGGPAGQEEDAGLGPHQPGLPAGRGEAGTFHQSTQHFHLSHNSQSLLSFGL